MSAVKGFLLGALLIGMGVVGYLFYQEQKDDVKITIDPPNVSVDR
jgi:hypothetical protein